MVWGGESSVSATPEVLRAVKAVKPLPDVVHRVLRVVRNPDYAIDELVAIVRTDPTLVARVLRLCNSARHGLQHEITAIGDAIAYVGTRNLVQIVLVTCAAGMFTGTRASRYGDATTIWHHSVACALGCQSLAAEGGDVATATAFTCGILHGVGRLVLSQITDDTRFSQAHDALWDQQHLDQFEVERRVLGLDHAAAAALFADLWQLPPTLAVPLGGHHDERVVAADDPMASILHVADLLALEVGIGNAFPRFPVRYLPAALQRLRLDDQALERHRGQLQKRVQEAAELLNLDVAAGR